MLSYLQKHRSLCLLCAFIDTWWNVSQDKLTQVGVVITWCYWCQLGTFPLGCKSMWACSPWKCIVTELAGKYWGHYGPEQLTSLQSTRCLSVQSFVFRSVWLVLRCWSSKPIKINIKSNCSRLLLDLNYLFKLQERCTQYNSERYKRKYSTAGDTAKINEPLKKNVLVLEVEIKLEWVFFPPFSHTHYKHNPTPHTHTNTKPVWEQGLLQLTSMIIIITACAQASVW